MARDLFLGIDGGGTSTRARLVDGDGRRLGEGIAGSSNLTRGVVEAMASVVAAASEAVRAAGLVPEDLAGMVAGMGLAGANVPELADGFLALPSPFAAIVLQSDAVTACLGAHAGADGGILILGTGSQGLVLVDGQATTVGGWGFELSDDGSGAVLGRAAVRQALRAHEGVIPAGDLTRAIMARFHDDPAEAVVWARAAQPRDYGSFMPLILSAVQAGDPVASAIVAAGTAQVVGLLDRLVALGARRIALMGGLAAVYPPYLPGRLTHLLVPAAGDAMDGAVTLARRASR